MTLKIFRFALAGALAAVSGLASAQSGCSSIIVSYNSYVSSGNTAGAADLVADYPECFGAGPATSAATIAATSFTQILAISNGVSGRFRSLGGGGPIQVGDTGVKSLAAGGAAKPWNVWASATNVGNRQSYSAGAATIKNDSDAFTTVVGGDYALSPTLFAGVSAAFDRANGSVNNSGAVSTMTGKGYTVAPYLGWQLSKELALDASAGLGSGTLYSAGATEAEADRMFVGANLSYGQWIGNMQLTGKFGYLHAEEKYGDSKTSGATNAGSAATSKIDQMRAAIQAGWWMNGVMPYVGLAYSADVRRTTTVVASDPIGKDAWIWTAGVNFFSLASGVTGGIAYNQEEGRTNQKNNSLMANINLRF